MADEIEQTAKAAAHLPKDVLAKLDAILKRLEAVEKAVFGTSHQS
jgi:hypothetical protein